MQRREEEMDKRQREIRQTRNTAQAVFQEKMTDLIAREGTHGKNMREIQFPIALSGVLDFSNLPIALKIAISRLKKLSFIPGELVEIKGLGEIRQLEELNVSKQLITELDLRNLSGMLMWKTLNLEGNGLRELDWGSFMYLKQLNVSYNRFVRLGALPRTLEIVDVRNNRLELLDLSRGALLRYVNASNNTTQMVVVPPPRENVDCEIIQNHTSPYLEAELEEVESGMETGTGKSSAKKGEKREAMIRKMDYDEGLRKYFEMKTEYERKVAEQKRQIWKKYRHGKRGSISAGRQMLSRYVPTCLNCDQPGGMLFQYLPEEKKYKALCGASQPCSFRIEIFRSGDYARLSDVLEEIRMESEDCKQNHIIATQEIRFGYLDELSGTKKSARILEECNETGRFLKSLEKEYEDLFDSARRKRISDYTLQKGEWLAQNEVLLRPTAGGKGVSEIMEGRRRTKTVGKNWEEELVEEEEEGREEERLRMLVETEVCQLFPLVHKLRKEIYDSMKVLVDDDGGCRLIQEEIGFAKGEYNWGVEPAAVLAFSE
jgi:hypothetical protein